MTDQKPPSGPDQNGEGTPITVALGHAELIERAVTNSVVADDAHVVTDELMRLRRLATRMLLLASAGGPDFLHLEPVALESVAVEDLQGACDLFRAVYDESGGRDGFCSIEVAPSFARDTAGSLDEARRLWSGEVAARA